MYSKNSGPSIYELVTRRGPSPSIRHSSSIQVPQPSKRPSTPKPRTSSSSNHTGTFSTTTSSVNNSQARRNSLSASAFTNPLNDSVSSSVPLSTANPILLATASNDENIEDKYIKNLQQQVQFLELELELQKKVNDQSREQLMQEAAPIEDSMRELKMAFVQKEQKFEKELNQYQEKIDVLEKQVEVKESESVSLREQLNQMKKEFDEQIIKVTQEYVNTVVSSEKEIKRLKYDLEREKTVIQKDLSDRLHSAMHQNSKLDTENKSQKATIEDLQSQLKTIQDSLQQWQQRGEKLQEKIVNLEQVDKNESDALVNAEKMYEQLRVDSGQLKLSIKQLEFDKEQLIHGKEKLEKQIKVLIERQTEAESSLDKYRHKLGATETQRDRLQKELTQIHQQYESLKMGEKMFDTEREQLRKKYEDASQKLKASEKEISSLRLQYKQLQNEKSDLDRDYNHARKQIDTLNKENEDLTTQHRLLDDRLKQFLLRDHKRQTCYEELYDQLCRYKAENRRYWKQLYVNNILNSLLQSGELQTIMNTNMNVASKISDLLSTIKDEDPSAEEDGKGDKESVNKQETTAIGATTNKTSKHEEDSQSGATGMSRIKRKSFDEWFAERKK